MSNNPILDEVHAARRTLLAQYHGDTASYLRDAQERLETSGRPIWHGPQRSLRCVSTVGSSEDASVVPSSPPVAS